MFLKHRALRSLTHSFPVSLYPHFSSCIRLFGHSYSRPRPFCGRFLILPKDNRRKKGKPSHPEVLPQRNQTTFCAFCTARRLVLRRIEIDESQYDPREQNARTQTCAIMRGSFRPFACAYLQWVEMNRSFSHSVRVPGERRGRRIQTSQAPGAIPHAIREFFCAAC